MKSHLIKQFNLKKTTKVIENYAVFFPKDEISKKWLFDLIFYYNCVYKTQLLFEKNSSFYVHVYSNNWTDVESFILYFVNREFLGHDNAFFDEPYTYGFVTNSIVKDRFLNQKIKILGICIDGFFFPKNFLNFYFSLSRPEELAKIKICCYMVFYKFNTILFLKKNFYINHIILLPWIKIFYLIKKKSLFI